MEEKKLMESYSSLCRLSAMADHQDSMATAAALRYRYKPLRGARRWPRSMTTSSSRRFGKKIGGAFFSSSDIMSLHIETRSSISIHGDIPRHRRIEDDMQPGNG